MTPAILHMPTSSTLSFKSHIIPDPTHLFLTSRFSHLSIAKHPPSTTIRMGGGPRTYPGGVSKWQWKRMQAKKAKQLLRARLARERQIYEMRKRAELNAAVSDLERPWEVVEKAPKLFSVTADEQLKVLADRFQKPGGFDLWSDKDGPQLFETVDGIPSARFFPKGVVHSIKPYGKRITDGNSHQESDFVQRDLDSENSRAPDQDSGFSQINGYARNPRNENVKSTKLDGRRRVRTGSDSDSGADGRNQREIGGNLRADGRNHREIGGNLRADGRNQREIGGNLRADGLNHREIGGNLRKGSKRATGGKEQSGLNSKVFDMNLQDDGSYGISKKEGEVRRRSERY